MLDEGKQKLADAEKQLEEGKAALAEGKKQIEDGEKQLAQFEDGRDRIIDGLEVLKATKADGNLVSIADRLGANFNYMKNDTDLDIDKGLEAVTVARGYSADNGEAVTKELTSRAVGAALALAGSLAALAAAIMGLNSMNKGAGVLAVIAAAAAVVALIATISSGTTFSDVAGSYGAGLATIAGVALAAVSAVHAVAAFGASKAAV